MSVSPSRCLYIARYLRPASRRAFSTPRNLARVSHVGPPRIPIINRGFATFAERPQKSILHAHPTQQDLDQAEIDADIIPPEETRIDITDRAAEVWLFLLHAAYWVTHE